LASDCHASRYASRPVQQCLDRRPVGLLERFRALFEHAHHARPLEPGAGLVVLRGGDLEQQMTARVVDAQLAELLKMAR
jgi:hypothetical protein